MTSDSPQTPRRRVAVTGSSGKLGRTVVAHLVESGWEVRALDRARRRPRHPFVAVDLTDYGQVGRGALRRGRRALRPQSTRSCTSPRSRPPA